MFRYFMIIVSTLLTVSCSTDAIKENDNSTDAQQSQQVNKEADSIALNEAIALARKNKDYRLLVTSGRSMSIPGVKAKDYQRVIALCGKKYMAAAGDVITSEEQRSARKKLISFMRQYNEEMLKFCLENKAK